jgi:lysozyme family protein
MFAIAYTSGLRAEYQRLFDTCVINSDKYPFVNEAVKNILASKSRYEAVASKTNVPWYFIAVVHTMECNGNFNEHLHNGDPLTARTVKVPAGRPQAGNPPFTWEFSAEDALRYQGLDKWTDWSLPGVLYKLEGYNGFGYRRQNPPINTPYLWSFSNQYSSGKYVADGSFSSTTVSKQCGIAVMLRRLAELQAVSFGQSDRTSYIKELGETVKYLPAQYDSKAEELQKQLNLNGAHLMADGKAGQFTSDAYFVVAGHYLQGDPRRV